MTRTALTPCLTLLFVLRVALPLAGSQEPPDAHPPIPIGEALATVDKDIADARGELDQLHRAAVAERSEAAKKLAALDTAIRELNRQLEDTEERTVSAAAELRRLQRDAAQAEKAATYLETLAGDYRRAFEARLTTASARRQRERLDAIDAQLGSPTPHAALRALPALLDLSLDQLEETPGGRRFPGTAATADGDLLHGEFVEYGPVSYFAPAGDAAAGFAVNRPNRIHPILFTEFADSAHRERVAALFRDGKSLVPFDATLGLALRLEEESISPVEHLQQGGVVIYPLLLLAAVCIALSIVKFLDLRAVVSATMDEALDAVVRLLDENRESEALERARRLPRPLDDVIAEGIRHRDAPRESLEEILYERILAQKPMLERFLTPLAVCAAAAPLLGLLGTVTGMIHTFRQITVFGTGNARLLSSGISEALITTEVGLMVAIPALLIHAYFARRVGRAVAAAQQAAVQFVNRQRRRGTESRHD